MSTPDRLRWARALVTAGWLFTTAYVALLAIEIRRAAAIRTSSFEDGVWGQRVEIVSFITLPQNIMVLLPAAVATVAAAMVLDGVHPDDRPSDPWLRRLSAVVGGMAVLAIGLALLGIGGIPFRYADPLADLGALVGRVAGIAVATGVLRLLREVR